MARDNIFTPSIYYDKVIFFITYRIMVKMTTHRDEVTYQWESKVRKEIIKDTYKFIKKSIFNMNEGEVFDREIALFEVSFGKVSSIVDKVKGFFKEPIYPLIEDEELKLEIDDKGNINIRITLTPEEWEKIDSSMFMNSALIREELGGSHIDNYKKINSKDDK